MMDQESLQNMSDDELAAWQAGWKPATGKFIMAEREWQRRHLILQHDYNQEIFEKQKRLTYIAIIAGIAGTVVGAIIGAVLASILT